MGNFDKEEILHTFAGNILHHADTAFYHLSSCRFSTNGH